MRKIIKIDPKLHVGKLEELLDEPKIIRVNEFTEKSLHEFEDEINKSHTTGQPVIPVLIDSFGGSGYALFGMVAAIESASLPVATIITTKAMSAGACLFCFGTEGYRFMHPDAWLMIHDVGSFIDGKVEEVKVHTEQMDKFNRRIFQKISQHLGHDLEYISNLIKKHHHLDWYLSAKEAKKYNIVNHLRIPSFEVELKLNINFI